MNSNITGFKRQRNSEEESLPLGKRQSDDIPCMDRALLVDEVTASRDTLKSLLQPLGIDTLTVNSAENAIAAIRDFVPRHGPFHFIFIDFDLTIHSHNHNVPELVGYIHSMAVQSKIVGMYTDDDTERKRMFYDAGATLCVKKSMDSESVSQTIGYLRNM